MKQLTLAAIGCGNRSQIYIDLAARRPECYRVIAGADPDPARDRPRALARALSDGQRATSAPDRAARPAMACAAPVV